MEPMRCADIKDGEESARVRASVTERMPQLLAFEAAYLERKLLRLGLVESRSEAQSLFLELKKYLALAESYAGQRRVGMFSARVDEVWHQFALFTAQYAGFCQRFFGHFSHHVPAEAPEPPPGVVLPKAMTFQEFRAAYEVRFGALPDAWFDERGLRPDSRLGLAAWAQPLEVRTQGNRAILELGRSSAEPAPLCIASERACDALEFMRAHRRFIIRELPGLASMDERLALCRPLVEFKVLRLLA